MNCVAADFPTWCYGRAASTQSCFTRATSTSAFPGRSSSRSAASPSRKNLEAFLALDLPGTKVVVGDGPARAELARKYPDVVFMGGLQGEALGAAYAGADVFVFPSKTDTFGLVLLEALASGVPVAAYPVTGPRDVIGDDPVGVLGENLRDACLAALTIPSQLCLRFAARHTWQASAQAFVNNISGMSTKTTAAAPRLEKHPHFAA